MRGILPEQAVEKPMAETACLRARLGTCFEINTSDLSRDREGAMLPCFPAASSAIRRIREQGASPCRLPHHP